ncbi:MAG: hypothetical protein H6832_11920 [Planctomycetes bacterium]|nr:hypothetical protein [Planctomycetota bacterium]MCB9892693.1 hypothetical protein [Planctomycetota bacterium]MCB9919100.1 hypothetical protein [Planctomycetota bacterium]
MILATGIGFALRAVWGLSDAPLYGLLAGLLIAPFAPTKRSCKVNLEKKP